MAHRLVCFGSFSIVDLWVAEGLFGSAPVLLGSKRNTVVGNDAVIVARELVDLGHDVTCRLLGPTEADVATASAWLRPGRVDGGLPIAGGLTRSLCLEDKGGSRHWLFSRIPAPVGTVPRISADFVYVDYYSELRPFLDKQLAPMVDAGLRVFLNLSELGGYGGGIPRMNWRPRVVQGSASNLDASTAREVVCEMRDALGAERAALTLGGRGALLTSGDTVVEVSAPPIEAGSTILGAGAVFSAHFIEALLAAALDDEALLRMVVARTSDRLPPPQP